MREIVKVLRNCQKIAWENQYPGYPYQMTAIIDMKDKSAYLNYGKKTSIKAILDEVTKAVAYHGLDSDFTTKGNFLTPTSMDEPETIIQGSDDHFYIDHLAVVKLYLGVNAAIKRYSTTDSVMFAVCDLDADYVDVRMFTDEQAAKQYVKDYWSEEY